MKARHVRRFLVAAVVAVAQLAACDIWTSETGVRIAVPPLPAHWSSFPGEVQYLVRWFDAGGEPQAQTLASGTGQIELLLPKIRGIPVLVHPLIRCGPSEFCRLLPAGALFPDHLGSGGTLRPTWAGGAATMVLWRIVALTGRPAAYHGGRLYREMVARTNGDPWRADLEAIATQLVGGSFRSTSIRPRPRFPVTVEAPAGQWLGDSPAAEPLMTIPRGADEVLELELETGLHRFFHAAAGSVLTVAVNERGAAVTTLRR